MKTMKKLPQSFTPPATWKLMKKNTIPGFWSESAIIIISKKRKWVIGIEMTGRALFLFTDLPRPDDGLGDAVYELPLLRENAEAPAQHLFSLGVKPKRKEKT